MQLGKIPGQEQAVSLLRRHLQSKRISHAYLFAGPAGVGKEKAARAFAQAIHCQSSEEGEACEQCSACRQHQSSNHPDFFIIAPDGASLKIDQIRKLQQIIRYKPYQASLQIVILLGADTMQAPAANALLKVLEEPPGPCVFILVSGRGSSLLPTILSRCQALTFGRLPMGVLQKFFQQKGVAEEQAALYALLANGSWEKAELLLQQGIPKERGRAWEILKALPKASDSDILGWAEEWDKDKQGLSQLLDYLILVMRDRLMKQVHAESLTINQDLISHIDATDSPKEVSWLIQALDKAVRARQKLETNASARLVFEDLLFALR